MRSKQLTFETRNENRRPVSDEGDERNRSEFREGDSLAHLHNSKSRRSSHTPHNRPLPIPSGSFDENRDVKVVRAHGRNEGGLNDLGEFLKGW